MKILVLDSDPAAAIEVPQSFLGQSDFDVALAATLEDALFALQQEPFDMVLAALSGPEEAAFAEADQLRERLPSLCVGFLAQARSTHPLQAISQRSALSLIEKPLTPDKLIAALHQAHQQHSPEEADSKREHTGRNLSEMAALGNLTGEIVGPFRVGKKLASSDWGMLYEAIQVSVQRPVALKVLNPAFYDNDEVVQQFISFSSAMARANTPYISMVYEAGREDGLVFYAREHVDGMSLPERSQAGLVLSEEISLRIIINIAQALNYEKKNAILHTPLLAEQILLPNPNEPKLLNNVAMEGGEISDGELDEICRLGNIIRKEMNRTASTLEFQALLDWMTRPDQNGLKSWDTLLHETQKLDLNRRAMKVVRTESAAKIPVPEGKSKSRIWLERAVWGVAILGISYSMAWFFYFRFQVSHRNLDVMRPIPAGTFVYQTGEKITLPLFYIDQYEVTIRQYRQFLEAWEQNKSAIREHPQQRPGKDHTPDGWNKLQKAIQTKSTLDGRPISDDSPVFSIDYFDAWAYAQWAGKRLPTEQEWEKAARGPDGNLFPWGNAFDPKKANTGADQGYDSSDPASGTIDGFGAWSPVGAMPKDQSVYHVMDMEGNVSEWTDSWDANPDFPTEKVPVIRGGSWAAKGGNLTTRNIRQSKLKRSTSLGFRCVSDTPPPPSK